MIWIPELLEPAENFEKFFKRPDNKILNVRNVWLLDIRNMGRSDHHESFDMTVSKYILYCVVNIRFIYFRTFQLISLDLWMSKN